MLLSGLNDTALSGGSKVPPVPPTCTVNALSLHQAFVLAHSAVRACADVASECYAWRVA